MKAGTFSAYPSHSADPYVIRKPKKAHPEPVFRPSPGPKSTPVKSIITINVNRFIPHSEFSFFLYSSLGNFKSLHIIIKSWDWESLWYWLKIMVVSNIGMTDTSAINLIFDQLGAIDKFTITRMFCVCCLCLLVSGLCTLQATLQLFQLWWRSDNKYSTTLHRPSYLPSTTNDFTASIWLSAMMICITSLRCCLFTHLKWHYERSLFLFLHWGHFCSSVL